jgi:pimeloyl-ACP methyl ester carboxylesterase
MGADVGVLIVHGMGAQREDFADSLRERLTHELVRLDHDQNRVAWRSGFWAKDLEDREERLWSELALDDLDWHSLRKFVVSVFGDAIAYQKATRGQRHIYATVHETIHSHLVALRRELEDRDKPLIVIAHSLGAHVISNFIWDARKEPHPNWSSFEHLNTLVLFVTCGCNIPLFTLAHDPVESIVFPPPELEERLREVAKWVNFYDADDVLGYPLKGLSPSYNEAIATDTEINVGRMWEGWNPLSHTRYWSDNDFTRPVARLIGQVLDVL